MRPILTITLNPALDLSTRVDRVVPGPKLRCHAPATDPGGGGINVSRVIAELGGQSRAFVALGGGTGQTLAAALGKQRINLHPFAVTGDTRQSLSVVENTTGRQFRFVMPGPDWPQAQVDAALEAISAFATPGTLVVLSGSLPPGVDCDFAVRLHHALPGCDLVADLSGDGLRCFAKARIGAFMLRMDRDEGEMLHGDALRTAGDTARFAHSLVEQNVARNIIIARGAEGSVLATAQGAWSVSAAKVVENSKTGAGDSFVGAMSSAMAQGQDMLSALRLGAAAASATVTTPATELCRRATVLDLLAQCTVAPIEL